jgi:hypothetical protein
MRKHAVPFTIAITLAGCGTNPCDISLLYENMTPEQRGNCNKCGDAYECPDEGETGDDGGDFVSCTPADAICLDGDVISQLGSDAYLYDARPKTECNGIVGPVPCNRSWFDPEINDLECVSCDIPGIADNVSLPPATPDTWPICWNGVFKWDPAYWAGEEFFIAPGWPAQLGCESEMIGIPQIPDPMFTCPDGMIGIHRESSPGVMDNLWTCRCPDGSDDSCQPDAVCEAGWVFDGLYPSPTLCVWSDVGVPDVGPVVYGLAQWSDGIVVDGDNIVLSPSMLLSLWPQDGQPFALFNDDQRADERGMITHCGAGSLCEHVGLHAGERIVFDGFDVDALLAGMATQLEVERPRNRSRWLTISVE